MAILPCTYFLVVAVVVVGDCTMIEGKTVRSKQNGGEIDTSFAPPPRSLKQRQGRTEACRYLVLLGMDPRQPDGDGSDAFALAGGHPSLAPAALSLAEAIRRRAPNRTGGGGGSGGGSTMMLTMVNRGCGGGGEGGGGGGDVVDGAGGGASPGEQHYLNRAPTAGSTVLGEKWSGDVEKGSRCTPTGDVGERRRKLFLPEAAHTPTQL